MKSHWKRYLTVIKHYDESIEFWFEEEQSPRRILKRNNFNQASFAADLWINQRLAFSTIRRTLGKR